MIPIDQGREGYSLHLHGIPKKGTVGTNHF
jgi:hypothetical protein